MGVVGTFLYQVPRPFHFGKILLSIKEKKFGCNLVICPSLSYGEEFHVSIYCIHSQFFRISFYEKISTAALKTILNH
jgi:hypothetical protein